jgi:hypothetical protein
VISLALEENHAAEPVTLIELLNRLHQSVMALHCVLEVAVMRPRKAGESCAVLESALAEADRALGLAGTIQDRCARVVISRCRH